jgi:hypothetical protein
MVLSTLTSNWKLTNRLQSQHQNYVMTNSQLANLWWCQALVRPHVQTLLLSASCSFLDVGHRFWWRELSIIYSCYWLLSAQQFLGLSPVWPIIVFYCLRLPQRGGPVSNVQFYNFCLWFCLGTEFVSDSKGENTWERTLRRIFGPKEGPWYKATVEQTKKIYVL